MHSEKTKALERLAKALGADTSKAQYTPDFINSLAEAAENGEIGGGSGGGIFWVDVSGTNDGNNHITFEKASHTAIEIEEAFNQDKFPILRVSIANPIGEPTLWVSALVTIGEYSDTHIAGFTSLTGTYTIDDQGNVTRGET